MSNRFHVALSFPGEDRDFVLQVADGQDISKIVKLTPIGKYYVNLRLEYDRQS